nr:putative retrotransposon Ty1-copia subclass protein [Tanacetum cinerariifolium]
IPPPPKREYPAKDLIFHECDETGHWKRNCPQYLAELLKKKKNAVSGSGGSEDLEIIQEEDTHPSIDTSLNHEEDDQKIDEPQSDINPIRRSTRTGHPTYRMCLYIDVEEHELGDLGEPANYKAALLDPDKWLFKKKTDMDGAVHTYKARLMAKGYTQTPGIDYEETFSHVADIRAIRIFIAIAAHYDYEIWVSCYTDVGYLTDADDLKFQTGYVIILNGGITKGARHFRAKVHYLREVIEYGDGKLEKVYTDDNLADPFTKVLAFL